MGTTLTPGFWEMFAVLLVAAMAVTLVLTAVFDTLVVRLTNWMRRPPTPPAGAAGRPTPRHHRMPVRG